MKQNSTGFVIGVIATIILGFGLLAGVWLGLSSIQGLGYEPPVQQAISTGAGTAKIELSTFPDSHVCHSDASAPQLDWVTYCGSTTLEVPANSLITVVINNYDGATALKNDYYQQVLGTVNGVTVTMPDGTKFVNQNQIDPTQISHTFTLQSVPGSPSPLFVNVPLMAVPDSAPQNAVTINGNPYPQPVITTFQFKTGAAGTYIWKCYIPCGADRPAPYGFSGAMSTTGYMAGTLTVTGN